MSGRRPASWMCPLDERILEFIDREDWTSPRLIETETSMNASWGRAYERLKMLEQAGLVERIHRHGVMFELTGEGQRYLCGELDAQHVERPNPHAV